MKRNAVWPRWSRPSSPGSRAREGCRSRTPHRLASLRQSLADATNERRAWMQRLFERLPDLARWRGLAPPTGRRPRAPAPPGSLLLSFVLDDEDLLVLASTPPPGGKARTGTTPAACNRSARRVPEAPSDRRDDRGDAAADGPGRSGRLEEGDLAKWSRVASGAGDPARRCVAGHDRSSRSALARAVSGVASSDGYLGDHATIVLAGSVACCAARPIESLQPAAPLLMVGAPQLAQPRVDRMKQVAPAWTLRAAEEADKARSTPAAAA